MAQSRSPGYPSMPLDEAIEIVKKIHDGNRTNPLDREAAAKEMGYTGISGRSAKVLSDLSHFGLLEKAGSGSVKVARRAVEILYPESDESRLASLHEAANTPTLFSELNNNFPDGLPSENALRAYLMRNSFASAAIGPIVNSYLATYRSLEQQNVSAGHGLEPRKIEESKRSDAHTSGGQRDGDQKRQSTPPDGTRQQREIPLMEGERVIFMDEVTSGQYVKVVASGNVDLDFLEGLEAFTKRMKKRLGSEAIAHATIQELGGGQADQIEEDD